eukprot:m.155011 g.155011  ORF g.155011 m.155011 type:complete len:349 (-) comp30919_c2_seq5:106-1152(-)
MREYSRPSGATDSTVTSLVLTAIICLTISVIGDDTCAEKGDCSNQPKMENADVTSMSVSQLKKVIKEGGGRFDDCFEKPDLVQRAKDVLATPKAATPTSTNRTPQQSQRKFSKYDCQVVDVGGPDFTLVVIILHGFGATNSDFVGLPSIFAQKNEFRGKNIRWVFPQAPTGAMGVPAWWNINVQEFMQMGMMAGAQGMEATLANLLRKEHSGLPEARAQLLDLVDSVVAATNGLQHNRVVLGGFSQGAMTAVDVGLSLAAEKKLAGLISLSGAPIMIDRWAELARQHEGLPILMTHGRTDMVLPFKSSGWLKDLLDKSGFDVHAHFHGEGHTLGPLGPLENFLTLMLR